MSMGNGTVVLYISDDGYLGDTYECYGHDDIQLAANLICDNLGIDYLSDEDIGVLIEYQDFDISRNCECCGESMEGGKILMGGLESVS